MLRLFLFEKGVMLFPFHLYFIYYIMITGDIDRIIELFGGKLVFKMNKGERNLRPLLIILGALTVLSVVASLVIPLFRKPVVTFVDGDKTVFSVELKKGEKVDRIDDPVRAGYDFMGWYLENEPYDFDSEVNKSITLRANWRIEQFVTFMVDNDAYQKVKIVKGKVEIPEPPHKDGYSFVCWMKDGKEFDFNEEIAESTALYAQFKQYIKLTSLKFAKDSYTVEAGSSFTAELIGTPDNWVERITYSSTDETIATIDSKGNVSGIIPGKVTVTAVSESGKKASAVVNVVIYPTNISTDETMSLNHGESRKANVSFTPETTSERTLSYSSSDSSVVSVDGSGNIRAVGYGEATITVTTVNGISRKIKVYANGRYISATINKIKPGGETIRLYYSTGNRPVYQVEIKTHSYNNGVVAVSAADPAKAELKGASNCLQYNPADGSLDREPSISATSYAALDKMPKTRTEKVYFEYTDENGEKLKSGTFEILIEAELYAKCTTSTTAEIRNGTIYVDRSQSGVFTIELNHSCRISTDTLTSLLHTKVSTSSMYDYTFLFQKNTEKSGAITFTTAGGQSIRFAVTGFNSSQQGCSYLDR